MGGKKSISRILGLFLVSIFLFTNIYSISVKAAEPVITFQNKTEEAESADEVLRNVNQRIGKTKVSNLRLINLEQPKAGDKLDTRATVLADGGLFWEIPVVWIDEEGKASLICLPGKTYKPVFAFFVPTNVEVVNDGENGYSLRLPEFLDGIYTSDNIIMVGSAAYGITYIVTTDIAEELTGQTDLMDSTGILSNIVSNNDIQNFFNQTSRDNIRNFVEYTAEQERKQAEEAANNNSAAPQTEEENSPVSESEPASDNKEAEVIPIVKDLVALHCSDACIEAYGTENLNKLLNLIVNVIEPQAVKALYTGFNGYSTGAKNGAIGKEIGLYVYSSAHSNGSQKDLKNAVAYVDGRYYAPNNACDDYRYYLGVNVDSLYEKDKDTQKYIFKDSALTELDNTMVHELMHACMDDYTRVGMAGVAIDNKENGFPNWFIEGTATCVDNAYSYHYDLFDNMVDKNRAEGAAKYSEDSLLSYYSTDQGDKAGYPSIDYSLGKYKANNNRAADYVSGYLATIYLASIANDRFSDNKVKVVDTNTNTHYYDSGAVRNGLNIILEYLNEGVALDVVVKYISGNKYENVDDFQKKFLTKNDETKDDSIDFCVEYLNYLDFVTTDVIKDPKGELRANGSILLPFDTKETSSVDNNATSVESVGILLITDSNDAVNSTVNNAEALKSGGLRTTGVGDSNVILDKNQAAKADASDTEGSLEDEEGKTFEAAVTEENATDETAVEDADAEVKTDEASSDADNQSKDIEETSGVVDKAEILTEQPEDAVTDETETEKVISEAAEPSEIAVDSEVVDSENTENVENIETASEKAGAEETSGTAEVMETTAVSETTEISEITENIVGAEAAFEENVKTPGADAAQEISDPLPQADVPDALASDEESFFETEVAEG